MKSSLHSGEQREQVEADRSHRGSEQHRLASSDSPDSELKMLNGNEAVAWAALAAGVDYFAHYPGSPINMVEPALKALVKQFDLSVIINDALNEHVAALSCAGVSYCGARSLLVMKHVGMNIAADPFNYIGYTGVQGGMVVVVGTDPGANSSTGEEDTHWYARQTSFPLLEPTSVREVFRYVQQGFDLSERYAVPVLVFVPGRLCFNADRLEVPKVLAPADREKDFFFEKDDRKYINVGKRAVENHRKLLTRVDGLSRNEDYTKTLFNADAPLGIVTRGLTFGHAHEAIQRLGLEDQVHLLNCGLVFPLNTQAVVDFAAGKREVLVIEDQDGFLETEITSRLFNDIDAEIHGKDVFPRYGEVDLDMVLGHLARRFDLDGQDETVPKVVEEIPERLGTFCEGCPHRGSFYAIEEALKEEAGIVGGDIGCSSLPPFRADWLMCMNAGIGISQGMTQVASNQTVVSTGGESTFFHGGIVSLHSAVVNKVDLLHIVFDNSVVGMTGRQDSPTTHQQVDYRRLLKALGVRRVRVVSATKPKQFTKVLKQELNTRGVRVIWVETSCAQMPDAAMRVKRRILYPKIDHEKCGDCTICYSELGCPAIEQDKDDLRLRIDVAACMRCGACRNICPKGAIKASVSKSAAAAAAWVGDLWRNRK